jgi:nucleosome assembly protein 1-like 1
VLIALDCICISEELAKPEGIPNFWLTVFKNSPIGPLVEEHDEPILKHLTDLSYEILPDNTGYRLIFKFSANEYFTNTELIKTVLVDDMFGDEEITETSATKIEWNAGKDVTFELKAQPAPRRGRGRGRGGRGGAGKPKKVPVPSFFHFFDALPSLEDNDDIDEEDFMAIAEEQERDQQLVGLIKDSIISRAAVYFTGEEKGMLASVGECWQVSLGVVE